MYQVVRKWFIFNSYYLWGSEMIPIRKQIINNKRKNGAAQWVAPFLRLWGSWLLCVFYGLFYLLFATCLQHVLLGDKVQLKNTASTYFSILKAELKQAFIDEYLTVDISAKVKGITNIETPRVALTMNEVQMLVDTPSFLHP